MTSPAADQGLWRRPWSAAGRPAYPRLRDRNWCPTDDNASAKRYQKTCLRGLLSEPSDVLGRQRSERISESLFAAVGHLGCRIKGVAKRIFAPERIRLEIFRDHCCKMLNIFIVKLITHGHQFSFLHTVKEAKLSATRPIFGKTVLNFFVVQSVP